ncbi:MAG: glutathione S-transferase family protein [Arenimonas sp.]|uniref:glutathione S-transferase family protein n=1 Tax=Arenimonas sp. TaxID=1872635 RepID=UPI0025B89F22|nr:glutathione S-transferase family protein [Arenimonas sp.]MBW8368510.1 glutathione S-transferase family protein [Arenimonas sp.]
MATTLVIGNKNYSSWSLRPWLLLRHYGVAFDEVRLLLDTPGFAAQVARWSPSRRVPALHDGDLVVWDSLAICEYANERWLGGNGWPADLAQRAVARSAAAEMHSGFSALRSQMPMNLRRQPRLPHWDAHAGADVARVQQLWNDLRDRHDGPYLCGDQFGIVDAMFAPVCARLRSYGVPLDATGTAYVRAIFALPAMQEWEAAALAETERVASDEA